MLTALILIALITGIVVLARRWPDVEAKLWPDEVDVPKAEANVPEEAVSQASTEAAPAEPTSVQRTAGGLMRKKALTTEPDVEIDETPAPTKAAPKKPEFLDDNDDVLETAPPPSIQAVIDEDVAADQAEQTPEPTRAVPATKPKAKPGVRVMGEPARPSQPAYVDATKRVSESFEQLSGEADKAWQDRSYEKAEQACLKILVQQPKNHKYMTRIGQIYQEKGELEDAKEAYEAAKKLDPKNFFVLNRLSEVERMINDKGGRTSLKKKVPVGKK